MIRLALAASLLLAFSGPAMSADLLELRASATDAAGTPLEGAYLFEFILWDAVKADEAAWREKRYVKVSDGNFSTVLGDKNAIPARLRVNGYRLRIDAPAATGWRAGLNGAPRWLLPQTSVGAEEAARTPANTPAAEEPRPIPEETQKAPTVGVSASAPPAAETDGQVEEYKKRIEALEKAIEKGVPLLKPQVNIYVVQRNDTLRSVSQKLYGNSDNWIDLYRANSDRIRRGGELVPGQKLLVPRISR